MAFKRPTLADIGSLSLSIHTVPLPSRPQPTVSASAQVLLSNISAADSDESMPDVAMEIDAVSPQPEESASFISLLAASSAAPVTTHSSVQMTQLDKIQAALQKIDPAVRAFVEEELRGRFVAVVAAS